MKQIKVAIVHDWLIGGGAELVVEQIHKMYPDAPIFTSMCTPKWRKRLDDRVVTGWLGRWPFTKIYKILPLFRMWWFSRLKLQEYDLVISSSGNGEAKFINVPKQTRHIMYCHSPTHFYWRHYQQYLDNPKSGIFNPLIRLGLKLLVKPLRKMDRKAAQKPDLIIANSTHIKRDIQTYYGRDSVVIHPPVDLSRFTKLHSTNRIGFITVGRQVPYKRIDLIVQACSKLSVPLTVIGRGPEHGKLVNLAGPSVRFLDNASDEQVALELSKAQAFIQASMEDFGITAIEAMASGTPVIALKAGGALDYVIDNKTGLFFDEQNSDSLTTTLASFTHSSFNFSKIRDYASNYSSSIFQKNLLKVLLTKQGG
jgi:glycosyltransferase involved in cell wall biosynthesis